MATKTHGESQFVLRFPRRLAARVQELMDQQGPHAIIIDAKSEILLRNVAVGPLLGHCGHLTNLRALPP